MVQSSDMGGKSTSQSASLVDGKEPSPASFDLHSWQGLTMVLKVGKEALSDVDEYNEFRNIILQYAQQRGDVELKKKIENIIQSFPRILSEKKSNISVKKDDLTERTETHTAPPKKGNEVGSRRIVPNFIPPKLEEEPIDTSKKSDQTILSNKHLDNQVDTHTKGVSLDVPIPENVEISKPATIIADPVLTQVAPEIFKTIEQYKHRISEIKRRVNEHVGNPATLINTHNELGKQYMTALLSALKATSGGGTEGVDTAMMRLEQTGEAILRDFLTLKEDKKIKNSADVPTETTKLSDEAIKKLDEVKQKGDTFVPDTTTHVQEKKEFRKEATAQDEEVFEQKKRSAAKILTSILVDGKKNLSDSNSSDNEVGIEILDEETTIDRIDETPNEEITVGDTINVEEGDIDQASESPQTKHANKRIGADPTFLVQKSHQVSFSVQQTELFSPKVTDGLNALLHEWSIFSGSGLFGIGPGGVDHPLFLRLAHLRMDEVIAGRWDSVDPKIVKSIKDYVNAWRHEQGITYVVSETFEHYLRRVIAKIIKRQNV